MRSKGLLESLNICLQVRLYTATVFITLKEWTAHQGYFRRCLVVLQPSALTWGLQVLER